MDDAVLLKALAQSVDIDLNQQAYLMLFANLHDVASLHGTLAGELDELLVFARVEEEVEILAMALIAVGNQ